MKKLAIFLAAVFTLAGCTKNKGVSLYPEYDEIEIFVGEQKNIIIGGADWRICNVTAENDFIVHTSGVTGGVWISGQYVGETILKIGGTYATNTVERKIKVVTIRDYIGDYVPMFGERREDVCQAIDLRGKKEYIDTQRGCTTYTYEEHGFSITDRYYYKNDLLYGIHKIIETYPGANPIGDIDRNLKDYMRLLDWNGNDKTYYHPSYHAAEYIHFNSDSGWYEADRFDIYFAESLDDAKRHTFAK